MCYTLYEVIQMPVSKAQRAASERYDKEHFAYCTVKVKKELRERILEHAHATGESINGFITRAIAEAIERDLTPSADP
jgi:predicted HicB family RNase H-like nuclease